MSAERETTQTATDNTARLKNRRFVGIKETVAYVLEDTAQSLNIDDFKERYIYDVVKIDFNYLAIQNIVATVWDTVNDTFIGVIVERTRTRWGKFRPYLLLGQFPLTILGLWYWLIPFIFPDTPGDYLPKWIFYFAMSIITETANTFTSIARSGFGSTITPEPLERSRLIATANFMSHFVEDVPKQIFGIIYDLVINNKIKFKLPKLFAGFGVSFAVIGAAFCLFFFLTTRERVAQTTISKLQRAVMGSVNSIILKGIGYVQGATIGTQSDRTKWWIFALGTGIPRITGALGIVPKFFYPITAENRERMYAELRERRSTVADKMKKATTEEEIAAIADSQFINK